MADGFRTKISGNILYVSVKIPRLDAQSSVEIKKQLKLEFDPSVTRAEVDLGTVQFIDSSGIGLLLNIYRKLPPSDGGVTILNVQPGVRAVLELLRLDRIFKVV